MPTVAAIGSALRALLAATSLGYLAAIVWLLWWVIVAAAVPAWTPVVITSGSMGPNIRTGDVVVAAEVGPDQLGDGTVIVFAGASGGLVTHRISSSAPDGTYRTKGDANAVEDSTPIVAADIVGRGRLLVPAVGRPRVWVHDQRWAPLAAWLVTSVAAWCTFAAWWRRATPAAPSVPREVGGREAGGG